MGILTAGGVASWLERHLGDPDSVRPVGTRVAWPEHHTATLVEVVNDRVVYGPEVPLAVYAAEVRDLPPEVQERLGLRRMHAWLFTTWSPADAVIHRDLKGWSISFSALPYSQNQFFTGRLRPTRHRDKAWIQSQVRAAIVDSSHSDDPESWLQTALDALTFIPFLQESGRSGAARSAWMVVPQQHPDLRPPQFDREGNYTVGLCEDRGLCLNLLRADRVIERLLRDTEDGTLLLGFESIKWRPPGRSGPTARQLTVEAVEKRGELMELAIQLALAGLTSPHLIDRDASSPPLVARQVALIYRTLLYNKSRRGAYYPVRAVQPLSQADGAIAPEARLREWYEKCLEVFDSHDEPDNAITKLEILCASESPGDLRLVCLVVAIPSRWPVPDVLKGYLRSSEPAIEDPWLRDLVRRRVRS